MSYYNILKKTRYELEIAHVENIEDLSDSFLTGIQNFRYKFNRALFKADILQLQTQLLPKRISIIAPSEIQEILQKNERELRNIDYYWRFKDGKIYFNKPRKSKPRTRKITYEDWKYFVQTFTDLFYQDAKIKIKISWKKEDRYKTAKYLTWYTYKKWQIKNHLLTTKATKEQIQKTLYIWSNPHSVNNIGKQ